MSVKAILEKVPQPFTASFNIKKDVLAHVEIPWHYHPEYELVYIVKSTGTRFVGDSVESFGKGDMVFIAPNIPHVWLNDEQYYKNSAHLKAEVIVLQFRENLFGPKFFNLPEMKDLRQLLFNANRGLKITGKTREIIHDKLLKLLDQDGITSVIAFLEILKSLSESRDISFLSPVSFQGVYDAGNYEKLNKVYGHIYRNFKKTITIDQVAKVAAMSKTAFCRYFKNKSGKTFSTVLNEIRISYSCKLLLEKDWHIAQVAYECGYNRVTYYNKIFKSIKKMTPQEYRRIHLK